MLEERDGAGIPVAQYLYGLEEAPLLMERDFDGDGVLEAGEQYLFHTGVLGNVEALTDRDGYVVERYDYGDFGAPVVLTPGWELRSGSQYDNPFLFNGQYFDEESNLYYYRLRYLEPLTGRFISHDPLGIWGDPENAVSARHPRGLTACSCVQGWSTFVTESGHVKR